MGRRRGGLVYLDSDDGVSADGPVDRGGEQDKDDQGERPPVTTRVRLQLCQPLHEKEH